MANTMWFIWVLLSNTLDQFMFLYLVDRQLPDKKPKLYIRAIVLIVLTSVFTTMQHYGLSYLSILIGMFLLHLGYCLIFRQGEVWQRVLWPVIARVAFFCIVQIIEGLTNIISVFNPHVLLEGTPESYLMVGFDMAISCLSFYAISRQTPRTRSLPPHIQVVSATMAIICIAIAELNLELAPASDRYWLARITAICLMIGVIVWLYVLDSLAARNAEYSVLQAEHMRMESEQRYTDALHESYDRLRDLRHDFRNQLVSIGGYVTQRDWGGLEKHLAELQVELQADGHLQLTEFPQLDAIISYKLRQAVSLDIKVESLIIVPKEVRFSIADLCAISGNILDNAIEAAQQVPIEQRYLTLSAAPVESMWRIRLENSCTGNYRIDEGEMLTTKKSGWHGVGLRRVQQLAEKHGGYVVIDAGERRFVIEIYLPMYLVP